MQVFGVPMKPYLVVHLLCLWRMHGRLLYGLGMGPVFVLGHMVSPVFSSTKTTTDTTQLLRRLGYPPSFYLSRDCSDGSKTLKVFVQVKMTVLIGYCLLSLVGLSSSQIQPYTISLTERQRRNFIYPRISYNLRNLLSYKHTHTQALTHAK